MSDQIVSSTYELKKKLLERALKGQSKYTHAEMIAMICDRVRKAKEIPTEHAAVLDQVRGVKEPRSVMALNALEQALGTGRTFTAAEPELFCIMPESPTVN